MQLSTRLSTLLPDGNDGWGLHDRARAMARAGRPVTMLTIGEHDRPTPSGILDAMDRAARAGATGYTPVAGLPELRALVASRVEARTGVRTRPENVLITAGGQSALLAAHMAALDPGDTALLVDPYYTTYPGTIRAAGAIPKAVRTRAEDEFCPSAAALSEAARGARSLLINTPNNPTGQIYDRVNLARIAATCHEHDLWLISDEVYETQVWSGVHVSPRELAGMADRTLVVGSLSKSHAMTGSRVGWIVGPERAIAAMADLALHSTYGIPGFVQEAAIWALRQGPALEAEIAEPFRRRRVLAEEALSGAAAVEMLPSDGAMYAMLDVRATGLSGTDFALGLLEAEGIAVMPGESFGRSAAGHVRVALTVEDEALEDALLRLAVYAESRSGGGAALAV